MRMDCLKPEVIRKYDTFIITPAVTYNAIVRLYRTNKVVKVVIP